MSIFSSAVSFGGKIVQKVKFRSPELLIGAGVVGLVGAAVAAVRRGVRWHNAAKAEILHDLETIKKAEGSPQYTREDRIRDYAQVIGKGIRSFTQIYGPSMC